ncbi:MAG: urease accessory protein UreH domain-containing protein, partial [Coriobacteriia bacterium]
MFGVGLVTSIHCVAMCGPLVLTYAVKGSEQGSFAKRMLPHLAYQSAKI